MDNFPALLVVSSSADPEGAFDVLPPDDPVAAFDDASLLSDLDEVLLLSSSQLAKPNISLAAFFAAFPAAFVFFVNVEADLAAPDMLSSAFAAMSAVSATPLSLLFLPVSSSVSFTKADDSPTIFLSRALT